MAILDIGQSMRDDFNKIDVLKKRGIVCENYPDIQFDLSEEIEIENTELNEKYDIICLAVLEHVYNPFIAVKNLRKMLKKNGVIYGYAPFLYHYHAPEDLYFQDYYRFSKDGLAYLFNEFDKLKLYPVRGRLSSSMHILFGSIWKDYLKNNLNQMLDKFYSKIKTLNKLVDLTL